MSTRRSGEGPVTKDSMMSDSFPPEAMADVIEEIHDAVDDGEETNVGDLLDAMGRSSFVPVLMVPALAVVSPLSGVPGFSSAAGIIIALVSAQLLVGRKKLWLPDILRRRRIPSHWLERATRSLWRPARWFDRHTRPRLTFLAAAPFDRLIYLACMLCGSAMPFMELLPFTSSLAAMAVVLMSLTLLVRDGLFALAGYSMIALLFTSGAVLIF